MRKSLQAALAALVLLVLGTAAAHATASGAIVCTGVNNNFQTITCPDINEEITNLDRQGVHVLETVAGTNDITASGWPYNFTAYVDGQSVRLKPANNITGPARLNLDSLGLKAIVKQNGDALASGDLVSTTIYLLTYFASDDHFRVMGAVGTPGADDDVPEAADYLNLTGGVGIDNTPTGTLVLDLTEVNSATFGDGSFTALTFNAGAVDPVLTFGSGTITLSAITELSLDDEATLKLFEEDAGGTNFKAFKAPAAVTASTTCTFEDDANFIPDSCVGNGTDDTGTVGDADYGDITVSGSGLVWNIDAGVVSTGEIATDGVSADELNATGVEAELEAVIELADLQGDLPLGTKTSGNYVLDVADGTGIDGTAAAEGATYTPSLDLTEISSATWGAGSFTAFTFDAGAVDPVLTFGSGTLTLSAMAQLNLDDELELRFFEEDAGGANYIGFKAPAAITSNVTCTFEDDAHPIPDSCVGNGVDEGAGGGISNVVEDTTPQLGGFLDWNGQTMSDALLTDTLVLDLQENALRLTNDAAGATGVQLTAHHDSASPADGDLALDIMVFAGTDDEEVGRIALEVDDGATTTEDTRWRFFNDVAGSSVESLTLTGALGSFAGSVTAATDVTATAGDVTSGDDIISGDDVLLSNAGVINFGAGDCTLTEGTDTITIAGTCTLVSEIILPDGDNTRDFGSTGATWAATHTTTIELGNATDATIARTAAGEASLEGDAIKHAGKQMFWVGAGAFKNSALNPASCGDAYDSGSNDVSAYVCAFDAGATEENAEVGFAMPKGWNESTITMQVAWTNAAGLTTETVQWKIACTGFGDDDALNTAYPADVTISDTWTAQNDYTLTAETSAITVQNAAEGDWVNCRVGRDTSVDNLTGDALLIGLKVYWTDNASTLAE